MAESRRKLDSKKYQPKDEDVDEAAQKKHTIMWLIIFAIGAVVIVGGMFLIAHFLSNRA